MSKSENTNDSNKAGQSNASTGNTNSTTTNTLKLAVFEEDDYFEEFDVEECIDNQGKDDIDFKRWQEDWEDEDINDNFDKVLRKEMEVFKAKSG